MNKVTNHALMAGIMAGLISLPVWSADTESNAPMSESSTDMQSPAESQSPETTDIQSPGQTETNPDPGAQIPRDNRLQQSSSELANMKPEDLLNKKVMNSEGKEIGKISDVVVREDNGSFYVVVEQGGFMGMGGSEYVVQLQDVSKKADQLVLRQDAESQAQQQEYQEDRYIQVRPKDRPISEFSAFEEVK